MTRPPTHEEVLRYLGKRYAVRLATVGYVIGLFVGIGLTIWICGC